MTDTDQKIKELDADNQNLLEKALFVDNNLSELGQSVADKFRPAEDRLDNIDDQKEAVAPH